MVCEPIVLCGTIPFMTKPIDVTATSAILPDLEQKPTYVNQMFASIAGRYDCLLYTSDAADERSSVDLGGRRIIKKNKR